MYKHALKSAVAYPFNVFYCISADNPIVFWHKKQIETYNMCFFVVTGRSLMDIKKDACFKTDFKKDLTVLRDSESSRSFVNNSAWRG